MPLLEVIQTKQISASIRLSDTTATQVNQYAAFIRACADDVVEQALSYVFSKDRDFQEFPGPQRHDKLLPHFAYEKFLLQKQWSRQERSPFPPFNPHRFQWQ